MIKAFPKIFAIGDRHIGEIFNETVEITEKVDGSQFCFGNIGGELICRSKGKLLILDAVEKLFKEAVEYVQTVKDKLEPDCTYYTEYLRKPKHNTIKYDIYPKNHLVLFGLVKKDGMFIGKHQFLELFAKDIGIDVVPLIFSGRINDAQDIFSLIEKDSYLGGSKIEGIVVKNYTREFFVGGHLVPLMAGKYVSEKFKEIHGSEWKKTKTGKGKWEVFVENFKTEARWQKAVQHLKENGNLEGTPRDIGSLIKEVQRDIVDEEEGNIKQFLWNNYGPTLLRNSIRGLPEWYKEQLVKDMTRTPTLINI